LKTKEEFDKENEESFKEVNDYKNTYQTLDACMSYDNSIIIGEEEEGKSSDKYNEICLPLTSNIQSKRKKTILKRTSSEPKLLTKADSQNDVNLKIGKNEEIIIKDEELTTTVVLKSSSKKISGTPPLNIKVKTYNKIKTQMSSLDDSDDSAFNEIYFYNFENVLVEYLNKKYPK